jgi:hypothetical protein
VQISLETYVWTLWCGPIGEFWGGKVHILAPNPLKTSVELSCYYSINQLLIPHGENKRVQTLHGCGRVNDALPHDGQLSFRGEN